MDQNVETMDNEEHEVRGSNGSSANLESNEVLLLPDGTDGQGLAVGDLDADELGLGPQDALVTQSAIINPNTGEYVFKGLPLTAPSGWSQVISALFAGQTVKRDAIIDEVLKFHIEHGGAQSPAMPVTQAKKALSTLEKQGLASRAESSGWWRFPESESGSSPWALKPQRLPVGAEVTDRIDGEYQLPSHTFDVERQVGKGVESVYLYSFPSDRRLADLEGHDSWPVKIGSSKSRSPLARVKAQLGVSNPEWPVIHLVINTDDAERLEHWLHVWLAENAQKLDGPGSEWFSTSPAKIIGFLQHAFPAKFDDKAPYPAP